MNKSSHSSLVQIIGDMKIELADVQERINVLERSVKEIKMYLTKIHDAGLDNYSFLSPRDNADSNIEIEKKKELLRQQEAELSDLRVRKFNWEIRISQLNEILSNEKDYEFAISIEDREKKKIAKMLQDKTVFKLFMLQSKIQASSKDVVQAPLKVKDELDDICMEMQVTIDELKDVIHDFYPSNFGHLSLKDIFEMRIHNMITKMGMEYDVQIEDVSCETLFVLQSIYYIINESLINIEKHSKARKIYVHAVLSEDKMMYVIDINDDGVGFDLKKKTTGEGIKLIKDRVSFLSGEVELRSTPNCGTNIHIEIPTLGWI